MTTQKKTSRTYRLDVSGCEKKPEFVDTTKVTNSLQHTPPTAYEVSNTLETRRNKHKSEDPAAIANDKIQSEQRAGTNSVVEEAQDK